MKISNPIFGNKINLYPSKCNISLKNHIVQPFILIILIGILSSLTAQNKKINTKEINACQTKINDSVNCYVVHEKIFENTFSMYVKNQNPITYEVCRSSIVKYKEELSKNNPLLLLNGKKISVKENITSIDSSIPQNIWYQKDKEALYICIELSNFSTSSVGNGYSYLTMKFSKNVLKKSHIEETKYPLTTENIADFFK